MNIAKVDLNLLVYLDVLLREGSVTTVSYTHLTLPTIYSV